MSLLGASRAAADNLPVQDPVGVGAKSALEAPPDAPAADKDKKGKPENPWQYVKTPSSGEPRAIGDYSSGCVQGAQPLPLDGEGYQVMHPSRLRYYGHPELLDYIEKLGRAARAQDLDAVLIGDLSQPRGGRASGGHASHQTGLDVDVWFFHPQPRAAKKAKEKKVEANTDPSVCQPCTGSNPDTLTRAQREGWKARSVLDGKNGRIDPKWAKRVTAMLRFTAADERVERVFVHPIIKRELCALKDTDRAWLGKIRPWFGHDDHFHARLACPANSPDCTKQTAVKSGDGCDEELDWWFSEEATADRDEGRKKYQAKVIRSPQAPALCRAVLAQP